MWLLVLFLSGCLIIQSAIMFLLSRDVDRLQKERDAWIDSYHKLQDQWWQAEQERETFRVPAHKLLYTQTA